MNKITVILRQAQDDKVRGMKINTDAKKIEELLTRGVENVYPNKKFLEARLKEGKQLTLYTGYDPTAPTLHIGNSISLLKLRQFQNLGHKVIMLIGDFTGTIGDPTDRLAVRKKLTRAVVLANCKEYKKQASSILNFSGDNPAELKYNSEWSSQLTAAEILELATNLTVPRLLERDMFQERLKKGETIYLHEFMYPMFQAYDSVAMDVDGEVGGNDQTFNMLVGRDLMKGLKNKEKFVLTVKLLADATGIKMGKSMGNMVALSDTPEEIFGKVMSWTDGMIVHGFELCTKENFEDVKKRLDKGENPRDLKLELAEAIVAIYHGEKEAKAARENFLKVFQRKETPEQMLELEATTTADAIYNANAGISMSEIRRLSAQGAIRVDGKVEKDFKKKLKKGSVVSKGKRLFVKIK